MRRDRTLVDCGTLPEVTAPDLGVGLGGALAGLALVGGAGALPAGAQASLRTLIPPLALVLLLASPRLIRRALRACRPAGSSQAEPSGWQAAHFALCWPLALLLVLVGLACALRDVLGPRSRRAGVPGLLFGGGLAVGAWALGMLGAALWWATLAGGGQEPRSPAVARRPRSRVARHGTPCSICGDELATSVVACRRCELPSHQDCWDFVGGCGTYGCAEAARPS